jgi:hypothetical protein
MAVMFAPRRFARRAGFIMVAQMTAAGLGVTGALALRRNPPHRSFRPIEKATKPVGHGALCPDRCKAPAAGSSSIFRSSGRRERPVGRLFRCLQNIRTVRKWRQIIRDMAYPGFCCTSPVFIIPFP